MKAKENKTGKMVSISEKSLLSLVAHKLKDRVLFPEKEKQAREYLKKIKAANL